MGMSDNQPGRHVEPSDEEVAQFIEAHPEGASLEEIGQFLGLTRTRVGQLVSMALVKCLRRARRMDVSPHDFPSRETTWERLGAG